MKKLLYISLSILFISGCAKSKNSASEDVNTPTTVTENTQAKTEKETVEAEKPKDDIKWMSYNDAVKASKKKPKKIFIDVYTDWCGWCKKMDKGTFKDPKIATYMNKQYYAVKLNAESDEMVVFQGKEISQRKLAASVFKVTAYPSTVYLESDEKIIQPVPGYMDVATMDKILHYVGEDHYKTQSWDQFQMSYNE
jgi:thioredoxin-related protein